jgi:hypothetical protein
MDPYISSVLKELTLQAERDYDVQRAKLGDLASSAGAFGGSRLGVAESELGDRFIEDLASIRSQGLSNAFNNALNQYNVDIGRGFEGYSQLANLANTGQSQLSNEASMLQLAGQSQRRVDQALSDATYEEFNREQAFPYQQIQFLSSIANPVAQIMRGSDTTETQETENDDGGSLFGDIVGTGLSIASLPGVGSSFSSLFGGGAQAAYGSALQRGFSNPSLYGPGFAEGGLVGSKNQLIVTGKQTTKTRPNSGERSYT